MKLRPVDIKSYRTKVLEQQGHRCALCGDLIAPGQEVLDHDHVTGYVRGVLHRSCNCVLGRWENGRRFGKDFDPVKAAKGLHAYLTAPVTHPLHPAHGRTRAQKRRTHSRTARTSKSCP